MKIQSNTGSYVLIGLGVFFLLSNRGLLPDLGQLLADWWPLILIGAGVVGLLRKESGK